MYYFRVYPYLDTNLIIQSKTQEQDVEEAIRLSNLKPTYTPCVLINKSTSYSQLIKLTELPNYEMEKVLILLLYLFRVSYTRKYNLEKNDPNKWWYWDLSEETNIEEILKNHSLKKEFGNQK